MQQLRHREPIAMRIVAAAIAPSANPETETRSAESNG
jgi:hypothetical protein